MARIAGPRTWLPLAFRHGVTLLPITGQVEQLIVIVDAALTIIFLVDFTI